MHHFFICTVQIKVEFPVLLSYFVPCLFYFLPAEMGAGIMADPSGYGKKGGSATGGGQEQE